MRKLTVLIISFVTVLPVAYVVVGYAIYDELSAVAGSCDQYAANTPDNFTDVKGYWPAGYDYASLYMDSYEAVAFPSREEGITIGGWYVERAPAGPAVIVVHGLGSCKQEHTVLVPAGMLARAGYNVLLIDLRDVGDSTLEDGRAAIGNEEYLDALGAWDWLVEEKGIDAEQVGIHGNSMGAATTLIAFDQEPRLAAAFVDSPFSNLNLIIREELQRQKYPTWLAPAGIWAARLVAGDDVLAFDPEDAMRTAGERPIFILHGTADSRIGVHHSQRMADMAETTGADVTLWIIDGVEHVQAAGNVPAEYEARMLAFFDGALR